MKKCRTIYANGKALNCTLPAGHDGDCLYSMSKETAEHIFEKVMVAEQNWDSIFDLCGMVNENPDNFPYIRAGDFALKAVVALVRRHINENR